MAKYGQLSITLPTGSLGLGIRINETTGHCYVHSKSNVASPLSVGDVIISLNGMQLANVDGGVDAWVKLFECFATFPRTAVVRRAVIDVAAVSSVNVSLSSSVGTGTNAPKSIDIGGGGYRAGIINAITELKDRTGSSGIAIRRHMMANLPADKKWLNGVYLSTLKKMIKNVELVQVKGSYKLSADYKARSKASQKEKKKIEKKKLGGSKKKNTAVTSSTNLARVARVSLSPTPADSAPEKRVYNADTAAAAVSAIKKKSTTVTATTKSKYTPKANFGSGRSDIARKALELANATKPCATTNAALLKLQRQQQSKSASSSSAGFVKNQPASQAEGVTVTALVTKLSKESKLGIGLNDHGDGTVKVSSMAPNSLFTGTSLKVGMVLGTINGVKVSTNAEAVALFKETEGDVSIVASVPHMRASGMNTTAPTTNIQAKRSAAARDATMNDEAIARACAAAGYTLPTRSNS